MSSVDVMGADVTSPTQRKARASDPHGSAAASRVDGDGYGRTMTDENLLRRVADELDIRSIVARLAQYADDGDLDDYVDLFTEDAHWAMPGAPRTGRGRYRRRR